MVHVLVADATVMACELLASVLSLHAQMRVVGWEINSAAVLAAASLVPIDVALISAQLHDGPGKGLLVTAELRRKHPQVRSVVLLDQADRQSTLDAFRAGARGVLSRASGLAAVPKCVMRVSEGQIWASSQELAYLLDTFPQPAPARTSSDRCCSLLTHREQSVVRLVAEGFSNREIATQLHLSQHTVKNYMFRVFDKVGVSSRVELVLFALSSDMADPSPASPHQHGQSVPVSQRRRVEAMVHA